MLFLLDGFPLRQPFHVSGYHSWFSVVEPTLIEYAEIYTGGFPVRYGNRLSGVVDLRTVDVGPRQANPAYSDVFARMTVGDVEQLEITGNVLWARDELSISEADSGERAEIESRSRYFWLRADKQWRPNLTATTWL
ncbi:MAG: Plug domain-containing protein, partial [Steroidobacter sp.]